VKPWKSASTYLMDVARSCHKDTYLFFICSFVHLVDNETVPELEFLTFKKVIGKKSNN